MNFLKGLTMERKETLLKTGCSKILWILWAVLLCAVPSVWAVDITEPILGPYTAVGEVNIYADITYGLSVMPDSIVNIYAGAIGDGIWFGITISTDEPLANVTVHGTDFALLMFQKLPHLTTLTIPLKSSRKRDGAGS